MMTAGLFDDICPATVAYYRDDKVYKEEKTVGVIDRHYYFKIEDHYGFVFLPGL